MQLNYIASVVFGVLCVVLLFAYAYMFNRPPIAGYAVWVAAAAWASCWLAAAAQFATDQGYDFMAGALGMLSLAATTLTAILLLFALLRIA